MIILLLLLAACGTGVADPETLVVLAHPESREVRFLQIGSGKIVDRIVLEGEPDALVRDTARGRVYVTERETGNVAVVDVVGRRVDGRIAVGREPGAALLSPDSARLYVALGGENAVAVIDPESRAVSTRMATAGRPRALALSGDGQRLFVVHEGDGSVGNYNAHTGQRARVALPAASGAGDVLALTSDGNTLLIGARDKASLTATKLADRSTREVPLGPALDGAGAPAAIYPTPDGRFWLVSLADSETVIALPTAGGDVKQIPAGTTASGFAVAPGGRALASSRDGDALVELDLAKGTVTRRMRIGPGHTGLAVFSKASLDALRGP